MGVGECELWCWFFYWLCWWFDWLFWDGWWCVGWVLWIFLILYWFGYGVLWLGRLVELCFVVLCVFVWLCFVLFLFWLVLFCSGCSNVGWFLWLKIGERNVVWVVCWDVFWVLWFGGLMWILVCWVCGWLVWNFCGWLFE